MKYLKDIDQNSIKAFREKAVNYYHKEGRHHLPWRETSDPWNILLAEMLLRKTTAEQVKPVYMRLSQLEPQEIRDISKEALEEILHPLGIYKERARLLKLVGKKIATEGRENLSDWDFLINLPGVGPYAASMVLSTAFGKSKPGLDSNMIRVLQRVFSIESTKARARTDHELWKAAEEIVPDQEPSAYNWGVMDLASAVCKPKKPLCSECPMFSVCDYASSKFNGLDES